MTSLKRTNSNNKKEDAFGKNSWELDEYEQDKSENGQF